jgi:hypothetical protein
MTPRGNDVPVPAMSAYGAFAKWAAVSGTSEETSGADIIVRRTATTIYEYTP